MQFKGTDSHDFAAASFPYPYTFAGDRLFFADDNDWYWCDNTSLTAGTSYQAGLDQPTFANAETTSANQDGYETGDDGNWKLTDTGAGAKLGQQFQFLDAIILDAVELKLERVGLDTLHGRISIRLETDSAGFPSGSLITSDTETAWIDILSVTDTADGDWVTLPFAAPIFLSGSGTDYHIVLESDPSYKTSYSSGVNEIRWRHDATSATYTRGNSETHDGANWSDTGADNDFLFRFGRGLESTNAVYRHKLTARNSTYNEDSRPSQEIIFHTDSTNPAAIISGLSASSDPQVTHWDIYRTKADTTSPYYYITSVVDTTTDFRDTVGDTSLIEEIQSDNHYRLRDNSDTEVVPSRIELFQARLWCTISGEDTLYFSTKLENDISPVGLAAKPILGAFYPQNRIETKTSGKFITIRSLSYLTNRGAREGLAVYFDNAIGFLSGVDFALNPPDDFLFGMAIEGVGLIGTDAITTFHGRHVFVSRTGIYAFGGTYDLEKLSIPIQSILDNISDTNLALSVVRSNEDNLWVALDEDDDGDLDALYILDLSQEETQWKVYKYNFNVNDIIVRDAGTNRNQILVATNLSDYRLRKLEQTSGADKDTSDSDVAVVGKFRSHPINGAADPNRKFVRSIIERPLQFSSLSVVGEYPTSTVPTYAVTLTDLDGNTTAATLAPASTTDDRGHRTGFRVREDELDFTITASSTERDKIRKLEMRWK